MIVANDPSWTPDTGDVNRYCGMGIDAAFSHHTEWFDHIDLDGAFSRWLAEHDRQIAEKAYQEGYSSGWYRGWDDDGDNCCPDNPYRKEQS